MSLGEPATIYPFEDIVKQPHKCQQRQETDLFGNVCDRENRPMHGAYDLECNPVCKCGTNYNEFFIDKPTADQATEWARAFYIKGEQAKQHAIEFKKQLFSEKQEKGLIITINFDQKIPIEEIIPIMIETMADIKKVGYKWMNSDAIACYEFYSSKSPDKPKNPHCHIALKRTFHPNGKPIYGTSIAQTLERKYKKNDAIYNVDSQEDRTWKIAREYVNQTCYSKSDENGEKYPYTQQDIPIRDKFNLPCPAFSMGILKTEDAPSVNEIIAYSTL